MCVRMGLDPPSIRIKIGSKHETYQLIDRGRDGRGLSRTRHLEANRLCNVNLFFVG